MNQLIISPVITETSIDSTKNGCYTFRAPKTATKAVLKKQIAATFGVQITEIRTMVVKGEQKRSMKKKTKTTSPDWKKVIIKVKTGQKIDLFDIGN